MLSQSGTRKFMLLLCLATAYFTLPKCAGCFSMLESQSYIAEYIWMQPQIHILRGSVPSRFSG